MTKLIIVLMLKALEGRGAERMVTTLASAYAEMNFDIHVLCIEKTQDMVLDTRVQYHLVPYYQIFTEAQLQPNSEQAIAYEQVAKRIDDYVISNIGIPDLILANIYKINWIMAYSRLPNIINVLHTALSKQFEFQLLNDYTQTTEHLKMVYGAHPCSAVSAGARHDLLALIGEVTKTTTTYNPCDLVAIENSTAQPFNIEFFGLTAKSYIIHVGSFDTMKNHHDLLLAYAQTEYRYPLVLVGTGRLEAEIKQLAIELNIEHKVKFLGFQTNPYPLIAKAKLLVLSSKFEGFGYVIVEAQALNIAVISTDCPFGPRELLPDQNLVPVGDIEALAELMVSALNYPERYITAFNPQLLPDKIAQQYLLFGQIGH